MAKNRKQYTNEQKIAHYRAKIRTFEEYIQNLEALNDPTGYTSQDWSSRTQNQINEAKIRDWVGKALSDYLSAPKKMTK